MELSARQSGEIERLVEKMTGSAEAAFPAWNVEQIRKKSENRWDYVNGFMLLALLSLYEAEEKRELLDFVRCFADGLLEENGEIRGLHPELDSLDDINSAKIFFPLARYAETEKYCAAIDFAFGALRKMPRTESGSFWHKQIYPNQVWLDGLYMAMPFYMAYETKYDRMKYYGDIMRQFANVGEHMRDGKTGLYYHGFDQSRGASWADPGTGLSQCFWLRAEGWLLMALVDTLEQMEEQLYFEYRTLESMLQQLAGALIPYQHESGMFYQVIDRGGEQGNYLETSGTCMIACGILKAVRLGFLPGRYRAFGESAFSGTLKTKFHIRDGAPVLSGICLSAGLGGPEHRSGTPEYYYSEPVVENEGKGVAPFLMAYAEILRAQKSAGMAEDRPYLGRETFPAGKEDV